MLPVIISPDHVKALVIGEGPATDRRLQMLKDAGVRSIKHFSTVPDEREFDDANMIYSSDFDDEISARIFAIAEKKRLLINTEDKRQFCNFHAPAIIRRGDLLLTVSTAGRGPRLARRIRSILERMFGMEWKGNLEHLARVREEYKKQGYKFETMAIKIDEEIENKKMFKNIPERFLK